MKKEEKIQKGVFKTLSLIPSSHSEKPRLRIADILVEEEEEEEEEYEGLKTPRNFDMSEAADRRRDRSSGLHRSSPRLIIARCLAALRPARGRRRIKEIVTGSVPTTCLMNVPNRGDSPISVLKSDHPGRCRTDASFNVGVACGLLYLIGASKNEVTKMVEVRKEMEMLLQTIREELRKNDSPFKRIEPNEDLTYLTNNTRQSSNPNTQISIQMNSTGTTSYTIPESETILECDYSSQCTMRGQEQRLAGMDELEAELEAELELLQLHLDTEHHPLEFPLQQRLNSKAVMDTSSLVSHSPSSGEVIDPQRADPEVYSGVRPVELERKLHELLELRQQERIKELEEALECAQHKLHEKEVEISWWKDTARIISQHVPQRSRIVAQHDPRNFHSLG